MTIKELLSHLETILNDYSDYSHYEVTNIDMDDKGVYIETKFRPNKISPFIYKPDINEVIKRHTNQINKKNKMEFKYPDTASPFEFKTKFTFKNKDKDEWKGERW